MQQCAHIDRVPIKDGILGEPPTSQGCAECVAIGATWLHLRRCLTCGQVGCCEGSPNKHAKAHWEESGHPLIRSIRLDEGWIWCYEDNAVFQKRTLRRIQGELAGA